ncbi:MAG TPA: hypothetical protein VMV71_00460 [Candidatus Paceibacterota bacterium]|nr:hypothetical protein [Candidatus Paceibacterota bacterium]
MAPEFTATFAIVALAATFTVFPPVVEIIAVSALAGFTPPIHVDPVAQLPPVAVLVIVAASAKFGGEKTVTMKIAAGKINPILKLAVLRQNVRKERITPTLYNNRRYKALLNRGFSYLPYFFPFFNRFSFENFALAWQACFLWCIP